MTTFPLKSADFSYPVDLTQNLTFFLRCISQIFFMQRGLTHG